MKKYKLSFNILLISFVSLLIIYSGCELDPLSAPNWYVNANLPFLNKVYSLMDLLEDEENIYTDSSSNVYFNSQSNSSNRFEKDIKANGTGLTFLGVPTQLGDTSIFSQFDDSSFVTRLTFQDNTPQPYLNLKFLPSVSQTPYDITITIPNLINNSTSTPFSVSKNVFNTVLSEDIFLLDYTIINPTPTNLLSFRVTTNSSIYEPAAFTYEIPPFLIKSVSGRIKPVNLGVRDTIIDKPFGDNSVRGAINFGSINPAKTYFCIKRSKSTYQVDLKDVVLSGENWNGRVVKLAYLKYDTIGAPPQPIDSVFNLRLPAGLDSVVYYVNTNNSNVLNFISNIPKKIQLTRTTIINQNYEFGDVDNSEDLKVYFSVEIPLHFSILEPTTLKDTVFRKVEDERQRERLQYTKKVDITFNAWNHLPLMASVRAYVMDSLNNLLFVLTDVVNNVSGDSVIVPSAPVDINGFVSNEFYKQYTGTMDSLLVPQLINMRKIVFEYQLYTDPNQIPTVDGRVRIRSTDYVKAISFGVFEYRVH